MSPKPSHPQSPLDRATALFGAGRIADAERACRALLDATPRHAGALHLLGLVRLRQGRAGEARDLLSVATELAPGVPDHHNSLGAALGRIGDVDAALAAFGRALARRPDYPEADRNRALLLLRAGRLAEAAAAFEAAARRRPVDSDAWRGLLAAARGLADLPTVLRCYRRLLDLGSPSAAEHADLLVAGLHDRGDDGDGVFAAHLAWSARHGRPGPEPAAAAVRGSPRPPGARMRVGYVGPCFRRYTMARFLRPVLAAHDRDRVEVFLYGDVPDARADDATAAFRAMGHAWRSVAGLPDDAVRDLVRRDGVDVLVDVAGHMDNPRPGLLARRSAPVQVSYLGHPATSGLQTVDYRVTDAACDPPGATERWHTERLARLDPCCWCYDPEADGAARLPDVGPLPAVGAGGRVTFVAPNRLLKATPRAVELWRRVLEAVPGSVLAVIAPHPAAAGTVRERFARAGVPAGRLAVHPPGSRAGFLRLLGSADVALDAYPYNGMTTTCDALWTGVPVVTLAGPTHVSRVGASVLGAAGLSDLVAADDDAYVRAAASLAADLPRLAALRTGLRARVAASPLADGRRVAAGLEDAFERMFAAAAGHVA